MIKDKTTVEGLMAHLAGVMGQLDSKTITVEEAVAQAALVKQSNNLLRYELDVSKLKLKMRELDLQTEGKNK